MMHYPAGHEPPHATETGQQEHAAHEPRRRPHPFHEQKWHEDSTEGENQPGKGEEYRHPAVFPLRRLEFPQEFLGEARRLVSHGPKFSQALGTRHELAAAHSLSEWCPVAKRARGPGKAEKATVEARQYLLPYLLTEGFPSADTPPDVKKGSKSAANHLRASPSAILGHPRPSVAGKAPGRRRPKLAVLA